MKTRKIILFILLVALVVLAFFGIVQLYRIADKNGPQAPDLYENWLPDDTVVLLSETTPLPELADVIAETYGIPQEDRQDTRYYYNYVDLNEDGEQEILVVVMGMYSSGSGGDSAMLVLPYAGMTVSQTFTLIRTPILISDEMTNGAHDLIFVRSGGGGNTELVKLTCVDSTYSAVANAEVIKSAKNITGTAILGNDFSEDMQQGSILTLADS